MQRVSRRLGLALLTAAAAVSSCGGRGAGGSSGSASLCSNPPGLVTSFGNPSGANVVPIVIDRGPTVSGTPVDATNQGYVTITVCVPGTGTCQTIDHVWVDTGSTGLRLAAAALTQLSQGASLPLSSASATPIGSCGQFISSYTWGALRVADVTIGGERASSVPLQVTGDTAVPSTAPADCSNGSSEMDTVAQLRANGLLGIGLLAQDCGATCASSPLNGRYYACPSPSGSCTATTMPTANQLQNVVARFTTLDNGVMDNNGSLIQIPSIPPQGQATAGGWLIFGIDTQTNNQLGMALVFPADPTFGYIDTDTTYGSSTSNPSSRIDSGSDAWFFNDPTLTTCSGASGFFCSTATLNATLTAYLGYPGSAPSFTYGFCVESFDSLNSTFAAFNDLGGPGGAGTFDWGLPFFYGRSVFTAIEAPTAIAGNPTPFFAASTP